MALPITVPYTFGTATTAIPLSNLDSDYATVYQAVNGIGNGSVALANVTITGGTVSNVSGVVPTPFTANGVVYASSTSALATGSGITYNGTTFSTTNDASINGLTVGRGAGSVATNTAVGTSALQANTSGGQNVAVGYQAFYSNANSLGVSNVAVGWKAAYSYNGGGSNQAQVYIGASAGYYNVSGIDNTYVGGYAGCYQTNSYNTALGSGALLGASGTSTGAYNTAVGYQSLYSNTTANNNTAVGYQALYNNTTAGRNTAVGFSAGSGQTTGSGGDFGENVFIGYAAGSNSVTGSDCIYIGSNSKASGTGVNYEYVLAQYLTGKGTATFYVGGSNGAYNQANSATWAVTSDQRLKKNIVDNTVGLEAINGIRVRNFEYRTKDEVTELPSHTVIEKTGVQLGVIAQELQEILPDCVTQQSTGVFSVNTDNITWHLINAIKELNAEIQALKAKVGI